MIRGDNLGNRSEGRRYYKGRANHHQRGSEASARARCEGGQGKVFEDSRREPSLKRERKERIEAKRTKEDGREGGTRAFGGKGRIDNLNTLERFEN
jgi:hypothetical protein